MEKYGAAGVLGAASPVVARVWWPAWARACVRAIEADE